MARQHSALGVRTYSYRDVLNRFLPESDNLTFPSPQIVTLSNWRRRVPSEGKLSDDERRRRHVEKGKGGCQK